MSLQQSEARRERLRETLNSKTDQTRAGSAASIMGTAERDLPPPSAGAVNRQATSHSAQARRRAAARRMAEEVAEARAMGVAVVVKLRCDRTWSAEEDAVVRALYPDVTRTHQRLPHRTREAITRRAANLDILPKINRWTPLEVTTLQRLWLSATPDELRAALPRWTFRAINRKAHKIGLEGRGRPPLLLTGDPLCDALRDRCRVLGYSMAYLDRLAVSGTYFQENTWKGPGGHRLTPMVRALKALGGEIRVEWPD